MYTDEGISATTTARREGFNTMVADALAGKIDLIVTKSASRFARNTVDSLSTIRKLKENGTEVFFEKEQIWTFDGKGELLITIMSSLAQEESRSISENVTWGQRKRFADGKATVPFGRFLGYDRGENGEFIVNEAEAVIVRKIYSLFLDGYSPFSIAKHLTAEGIPTPGGKKNWSDTTVKSILQNEKYKGDALLQKGYTVDFLTKKKKANEGEIPQYYVEQSHPPVVSPAIYDMVQQELAKRKKGEGRHSGVSIFASRIKCGQCSSWFGTKVWHSTSKYRKVIYQCNHKFKGGEKCGTPHLDETAIKEHFVTAANKLLADKDVIIAAFEEVKHTLFDISALETERTTQQNELAVTAELIQQCVNENARIAQDQTEYQRRYAELVERFNMAQVRLDEATEQLSAAKARSQSMESFISELRKHGGLLTEFDERLWCSLVDFVTVGIDGSVQFTFKDGREIQA